MGNSPELNKPNWAAAAERLEEYIGDESLYGNFVRLRIELAGIYERQFPAISENLIAKEFDQKNPTLPLKPGNLNFDGKIIKALGDEVGAGLRKLGTVSDEISKLLEYAETHEGFFARLAPDSVFNWEDQRMKDLAEEIGSPYFALISFGRILATPFFIKAARIIDQNLAGPVEQSASCPICSAPPAYLRHGRQDSRWLLVCSICETHWENPPMQCPFCGCQDQDKLGALMVADDAIRPIMTCDECRHYVKTVDERKLPEGQMIIPYEEDTITMPFDMLVEREGYLRPHY